MIRDACKQGRQAWSRPWHGPTRWLGGCGRTVLRALPGIGGATAARLMREAGIGPGRRAGALTAGQRERLVAAVAAVGAELAARGRRPQCN